MHKITLLIPCRSGSERIENKNTRKFADTSLIEIKIEQVLKCKNIDTIIVSTNDQNVVKVVEKMSDRVVVHNRDEFHSSSICDTNSLISYFNKELNFEHLLWTHVTSPFLGEDDYDLACEEYSYGLRRGYDSLVSVQKCREFVWDEDLNTVNYDVNTLGRWPQTQKLKTLNIINSGIFLISKEVMKKYNDRVGRKPLLHETSILKSMDIDWPEDFNLAEKIWKAMQK